MKNFFSKYATKIVMSVFMLSTSWNFAAGSVTLMDLFFADPVVNDDPAHCSVSKGVCGAIPNAPCPDIAVPGTNPVQFKKQSCQAHDGAEIEIELPDGTKLKTKKHCSCQETKAPVTGGHDKDKKQLMPVMGGSLQ